MKMCGSILALFVTSAAFAASHGNVGWVADPAAGLAQAQKENKAAMLYFTADW